MAGMTGRRDVGLLSACFALTITGQVILVAVTALVGHQLADDKSLATLPAALLWLGTASATIPASFLMRRIGRRLGFMFGAVIGMLGASIAALSVYFESFEQLCLGVMLVGAYNGFNFYFRFAAPEVAPEAYRSRAISFVLAGGVAAAILGPELAKASRDLLAPYTYMGGYLTIACLALAVFVMVAFVDIPKPSAQALRGGRPLGQIARQPMFIVAVLGGVVAYGIMILVMTVTPLAMVALHYPFSDAALVIQLHVLGMYVPSFFTGHLVRRFGELTVMIWGGLILLLCVGVALLGESMAHFWIGLTLLGLGWNFLYIGGTTLLTEVHTVAERAKTQGANEFLIFGVAGVCSFLSGNLLHHFGWAALNLFAVPPVLMVLILTLWFARQQRRASPGVSTAAD
jgi:MFS family permease